ncbi:MAG: LTA synthase family protein [Lachnospiraceae bacterium]|nr:LTA synthase family protein [Lachnospiraceae bacterium]
MSKYKIVSDRGPSDQKNSKEILKKFGPDVLWLILSLIIPVALFYLSDAMSHDPFETLNPTAHIFNIFIYEMIFLILFFLIGRARVALSLQVMVFFVASLANYYVMEFRTNPIVPWDIFSVKTAASVAENYSYALPGETILKLFGFLALLVISLMIPLRFPKKTFFYRLIPAFLMILLFGGFYHKLGDESYRAANGIYDKQFTPLSMYRKEGLALNFLMNLHFVFVDVPDGYDPQEVEQMLAEASSCDTEQTGATESTGGDGSDVTVSSDAGSADKRKYPNIVVVMDEAFSDLSVLGDLPVNTDPIPFVHSLMNGAENTVSGTLNVSVVGGNTANTEYEFLTGNTMAFLPNGSIPYQQYVRKESTSVAQHLRDLGYETIAMHPYYATGWKRNEVYPLLGFEKMLFRDDFVNTRILRKYVDDASDFANIIRQFQNKGADPLFVFNVTMQNHSSYRDRYDDLPLTVEMEGSDSVELSTYLTLTNRTDAALKDLIAYFEAYEEDTVVVFFGDHQPSASVVSPIWKHNGKNAKELSDEDEIHRYQVPFVIWANFDMEEAQGLETSANYLASHVLECAGIPLADYQILLQNIEQSVPVLTGTCLKDADGYTLETSTREDELLTYEKIQYYRMFE